MKLIWNLIFALCGLISLALVIAGAFEFVAQEKSMMQAREAIEQQDESYENHKRHLECVEAASFDKFVECDV
jgi:hypothetical protein